MHGEMLAAGGGFQILAVSLQSADKTNTQSAGQIGIFSVGFMTSAPPRIAENINVRTPDSQSLINIPVTVAALSVVFCARFIGNHACYLFLQFFIKHGSQTDRLREYGGGTCAGHTVQRFVPPVIGGNSQPVDGRRVIFQLGSFFLQRHPADEFPGFSGCFRSVPHHIYPPNI